MSNKVVRPAAPADLAGLLELYRFLNPDDPVLEGPVLEHTWSAILGSELMTVFVAEAGDRLVASCTLVIIPNLTRGARSIGMIENVVTHGDCRRSGFGHAVLQAALKKAWSANCYKVMLASGNPATVPFYERAGFTLGGKNFFEARQGQAAKAVMTGHQGQD